MSQEPVKALFLDRDGVINVDSGYIWRIEDFIFFDGVFDACIAARDMGYLLVVVTNQAGIGRGLYTEQQFRALTQWKEAQFRERGIEIARTYFSPTHPDEGIGVYKRASPDRGQLQTLRTTIRLDHGKDVHAAMVMVMTGVKGCLVHSMPCFLLPRIRCLIPMMALQCRS